MRKLWNGISRELRGDIPSWVVYLHACLAVFLLLTCAIELVRGVKAHKDMNDTVTANSGLYTKHRMLELERNQETLNLALEFGFDPAIVVATRTLAADALKEFAPVERRFLNSETELTYLLLSIIAAESRGDTQAMGDGGRAYGLTQMHLSTAREIQEDISAHELLSIQGHLEVAVKHFIRLLRASRGNYALAVLAWNKGLVGARRAEQGYLQRVIDAAFRANGKGN